MKILYCEVNKLETKKYYNAEGKLHREDGPAREYADGSKSWYLNGKRHREDGPAVECVNGDKFWYLNDKRHRKDGPAVEWSNGNEEWYLNDEEVTEETVRKLGKMIKILSEKIMSTEQVNSETDCVYCKVDKYGNKRYYNTEGQCHRENGPAIETNYAKEWLLNGKRHREDGPAIEYSNGNKYWYLNDVKVTEEIVFKLGKMKDEYKALRKLSQLTEEFDGYKVELKHYGRK